MKLLLIIYLFSTIVLGQSFNRFVLIQNDGTRIVGEEGNLKGDVFKGVDEKGAEFSILTQDIDKIYIAKKSKMVPFAFLGLLTGAVIGATIDYDRYTSSFRGDMGVIIGCSLAGAGIGAIIGSNTFYWEIMNMKVKSGVSFIPKTSAINVQFKINL